MLGWVVIWAVFTAVYASYDTSQDKKRGRSVDWGTNIFMGLFIGFFFSFALAFSVKAQWGDSIIKTDEEVHSRLIVQMINKDTTQGSWNGSLLSSSGSVSTKFYFVFYGQDKGKPIQLYTIPAEGTEIDFTNSQPPTEEETYQISSCKKDLTILQWLFLMCSPNKPKLVSYHLWVPEGTIIPHIDMNIP